MNKNVFISWSGQRSFKAGKLLYEWLPKVIQAIEPFLSSEDIEKGTRWFSDIETKLEQINYGILCITHENVNAPWIMFEAGALSRSLGTSRVTPFLVGLSNSDLQGPLTQFTTTSPTEEDMKKLVRSINNCLGERSITERLLDNSFDLAWPSFEDSVDEIVGAPEPLIIRKTQRDQESILEEILGLTRAIAVEFPRMVNTHTRVSKWNKEFTRLVWNTLVDMWESGGNKSIRSVEIFDRLMSNGEEVKENDMERSLAHLLELGCITGKRDTNSAGDIRKHGSILVIAVNMDCGRDF
jgi:hypothetical protein